MPSKSGGQGKRDAKRAAAREDKVPSRTTLWRAKKAREAAAAEDYDNVGPIRTLTILAMLINNKGADREVYECMYKCVVLLIQALSVHCTFFRNNDLRYFSH